ncbi:MAG: hypothetical protein HGA22_05505, partial [Clostridiales bacterium]|nr:hypothetical protein [Clostridiales bacterium]
TKFGYNTRSLAFGQQIAVNVGINEKLNAILCYAVCGGIVAIVGVLKISRTGTAMPVLGLATIPAMFAGFLPLFISDLMRKWSEPTIGILAGALITALISSGMASLSVGIPTQNIITAIILLLVLGYGINEEKIRNYSKNKKRLQAAQNEIEH